MHSKNKGLRSRRCGISWTNEMTSSLIGLVEERECLWNTTNSNYSVREFKDKAWREIAQKLNVPRSEPTNKWNSLRTGYMKALSKERESKSGDGAKRKIKNSYFDDMNFLLPVTKIDAGYRQDNFKIPEHEITPVAGPSRIVEDDSDLSVFNSTFLEDLATPNSSPRASPFSFVTAKKRRRTETPDLQDVTLFNAAVDVLNQKDEDKYDLMGNFVALNMRNWSDDQLIVDKFTNKLYSVISETQLEYSNRKHNIEYSK